MTHYLDCYFRVSTQEQTKGQSLDTQQEYGKKIAEKLNLKFRPRDEGAKSSTRGFRPQLEEIKEDIEKGLVKHLWVFDRSRLFRDETDSVLFRRNYLERFDVRFYEGETGNLCNFDSLEEKLTYDIVSKLQQYENEKRSHKSKQGKRHLLKQGVENRHYGGTVLFGYQSEDGVLSVHQENSEWVKFIFDGILKGLSVWELKSELDKSGVKPPRTRNGLWNLGTIQKILSNRAYIGEKEFYDKELDITFTYNITPIIKRTTFLAVRKEMQRRLKVIEPNKKHFSLFGDFLFCECGQRVGSEVKKGTRKSGEEYNTSCYHCVSRNRLWKYGIESNCTNKKSMNMELTDTHLIQKITDVVQKSHILKDKFKNEVLSSKLEKDQNLQEREKKLEKKCRVINTRMEQTYTNIITMETDLVQGRRDEKVTRGILKSLNNELDDLKDELQKTELDIANLSEEKVWLDWLSKYGNYLETKIAEQKENQKDWLKGIIEGIFVHVVDGQDRDGNWVQVGHKFEIIFKLRVVKDKFNWKDPNNKSLGYDISEGRKKLTTDTVNLQKGRGKKKELIQSDLDVTNYNHSLKPLSDCRIVSKSDYFSTEYSQYLCFSVYFSTNNLVYDRNLHFWTESQQVIHDQIKSLHDSGMGYRRIAKHLNKQGIKTIRGNEWGSNNVYSVLKRNIERLKRLEVGTQESETEYGKMELVWLRDGELYFNPRKVMND